ncbi:MAG: N-acetylmuramoyl-L-alanine amidase [Phycisphaerae bacterium]|nr:N-acetylmuramoyl-L-alanine amidase [Phycisphaerae bacterium]
MQRIALSACLVVLALAGCRHQATRTALGPPPGPILSTHAPPVVRPLARRVIPQMSTPRPVFPPTAAVTAAEVRIAGGIKKSKWNIIVVHHSAARQATPQSMHRYHRDVRKWSNGLGYHFVIGNGVNYPDGKLYVGPRWKRQITGAHCASPAGRYIGTWYPNNHFNEHGIGICLIGNFERERPTARQLQTLKDLIAVLVREAGVSPSQVYGHGEITHKTACPGRHLNMRALRH